MSTKVARDAASARKATRNLLKQLQRRHKPNPVKHGKTSIEHLIYVILAQRNPERRAAGALRDLRSQFAGWNEVRVSSVLEIGEVLRAHNVLNPLQKAEQVIRALSRTFSDVHKFKLEDLSRDDAEETRVYMARKLGLPGYVVADYLFSSFGYGRIPIDDSVGRFLHRLGFVAAKHEFPKFEKTISEGLTSRECADAYRILDAFATETCTEKEPHCPRCPLFSQCPEGKARKAAAEAAKLAPPIDEKVKAAADAAALKAEEAAAKLLSQPAKPPMSAHPPRPGQPGSGKSAFGRPGARFGIRPAFRPPLPAPAVLKPPPPKPVAARPSPGGSAAKHKSKR
ncbi:MAG: hypothetical protein AAB074_06865 [Planctomycetota bacterium]